MTAFVLVVAFGLSILGNVSAKIANTRVVGGIPAHENQLPWVVAIYLGSTYLCTGTLIHERWVLTAAHCIISKYGFTVGVGSTSLKSTAKHKISKIVTHPDYHQRNRYVYNDLALLRIGDGPVAVGDAVDNVKVVEFERGATTPSSSSSGRCLAAGWGEVDRYKYPDTLYYYNTSTIGTDECRGYWSSVGDRQICTEPIHGTDTCRGDSGGPLMCDGRLAGVLSFGSSRCGGGRPAVYARVAEYLEWITAVVRYDQINISMGTIRESMDREVS